MNLVYDDNIAYVEINDFEEALEICDKMLGILQGTSDVNIRGVASLIESYPNRKATVGSYYHLKSGDVTEDYAVAIEFASYRLKAVRGAYSFLKRYCI